MQVARRDPSLREVRSNGMTSERLEELKEARRRELVRKQHALHRHREMRACP
jgi:hypothetical protein